VTDAPPSLKDLHDIVVPDGVDFWPPAPGTQVCVFLLGCAGVLFLWRRWQQVRANAYRKEALLTLEAATSPLEISVVLKRCARLHCSAQGLSAMTPDQWLSFLEETGPSMPTDVKGQWQQWVYEGAPEDEMAKMNTYAAEWIRSHRFPQEEPA